MSELQQYIQSHLGIPKEQLPDVAALFTETQLNKGDYFVKAGQYCDKLSFVQSGYVRIFARAGDKEITQWISTQGYFVTDLASLVFGQRARWNMQALTDCRLYTLHRDAYRKLHTVAPHWGELEKQFISHCFITLEDRVFTHLSLSAEERYDQLWEYDRTLFQHVPLNYLASMLGMTPETFSRIRKKKLS